MVSRSGRLYAAILTILWQSGSPLAAAEIAAKPELDTALRTADATRGKALYQACTGCHSIDENDIGPRHRGVVGRHAGSVSDYAYSEALKTSGVTWDAVTLNRWLANPSAMVPGTKMFFRIDDPQMRADIIAFLEQLK